MKMMQLVSESGPVFVNPLQVVSIVPASPNACYVDLSNIDAAHPAVKILLAATEVLRQFEECTKEQA